MIICIAGKDGSRALGRMTGGTPQVPPPIATKAYAAFRSSLPVAALQDMIVQTVAENQVTIISGETGCGKTTQVIIVTIHLIYYKCELLVKVSCLPQRLIIY